MKYDNQIVYQPKELINPDEPNYFIAGLCLCGSRHYSENMTYEEALATMHKYVAVVEYFGGGVVKLIEGENTVLKYRLVH